MTYMERQRTLGTLNQTVVGSVSEEQSRAWILAASIVDAPWVGEDDDLRVRAETTGQLPPAFADYLETVLEELNTLDEGN